MALVLQDRVRETSASTGTGAITLGGAYTGYRTFASCIPTGSVVYYCIQNTAPGTEGEWEVGYGTYTLISNELSRDHVYDSSTGLPVSFTGPSQLNVFITQPADQAVYQETNGDVIVSHGVMQVSLDGTALPKVDQLPNVAFQAFSTINSYMQTNMQNLDSSSQSSADYVATADAPYGTDTDNYIDLGMASSGYNYPEFSGNPALSGYIQCTADNGIVIQAGKYGANVAAANASATDIVFSAGDLLTSGYRGYIKGDTGNWIIGPYGATDTGENLQVLGTVKVTGNTAFGANVTLNANPTANLQAATKQYVDAQVASGFTVHPAAVYATAAVLPNSPNYDNGTGGVGATLAATTDGALVIDGIELADPADVGIRVLVKSQANAAHNGSYTVTAVGGPSATWELTRSTDFDTAGSGEIANNAYFYVTAGTTQIGSSWILSQLNPITVGTTALPFTEFAAPIGYTVEYPLQLSNTTLSLSGVVAVANGGTNLAAYSTGDLLYASGTTTLSKRNIGSTGAALIVSGGYPNWGTIDLSSSNAVSSTLGATNGGTGQNTYVLGDLLYSSATNTLSKLAGQTTTTKKYLQQQGDGVNSAAPSWQQIAAADISGLAPSATTDTTNATNITSGTLATGRLSGSYTGVTGVGNLTAGTWSANVVAATYGGTGVAGTITGLAYANGASAYTAATGSQVVSVIGTTPVANATYAVSANSATYASNIIGSAVGGIPYQTSANTTAVGSALTFDGTTFSATNISTGGSVTMSGGTANGVAYLNGSKVLTTGSALGFTGTNFGIGTLNPDRKLYVYGAARTGSLVSDLFCISDASTYTFEIPISSSEVSLKTNLNNLSFQTVNTERMRIDSAGKLGLNVVPNTWSAFTAAQIGPKGAMSLAADADNTILASNMYYNSGYKRAAAYASTMYQQGAGAHYWMTAASGAADSAISYTQAMTLDASGNLGIGTGSPSYKLEVQGTSNVTAAYIRPQGALPDNTDNAGLYVLHQGTAGTAFQARTDNALTGSYFGRFLVNNASASINGLGVSQYGTGFIADFDKSGTSVMRIANNGNVGIGTSSPGAKLDVQGGAIRTYDGVTDYGRIEFYRTSTGATYSNIKSIYDGSGYGAHLTFSTAASSGVIVAPTERMRISSSGSVSIGNTTDNGAGRNGFTGTTFAPNIALTDAATVAWDTSLGQVATFTFVSSSRTMGAPTNLVNGGFYALAVIQNSGSNTLTWNSVFKFAGGAAPTLSTAASAKDYFVFRSDGTNLYCQGYSLGVA